MIKTSLVRIGNSQGVRIPKPVIEQCGLQAEVTLSVRGRALIVESAKRPRAGWDAAFAEMAKRGDDRLVLDGARAGWDDAEWTW